MDTEVNDMANLDYVIEQESEEIISFYHALETELGDKRGKQGKKHYLPFVLMSFTLGLIALRTTRSSVHRFMINRFDWLCNIVGHQAERSVSYTQLGRIFRGVDVDKLNTLSIKYFGTKIEKISDTDWVAGDGKDLKGSLDKSENASRNDVLVRLVTHKDKAVIAASFYHGNKESEIVTVRNLLNDNDLNNKNITLDALHTNPITTEQIASKGGHYLVQAKAEHQKELVKDLTSKARRLPCLAHFEDIEKGHGRLEKRVYDCYHIRDEHFEKRWKNSDLTTCIHVHRHFTDLKTGKISEEKTFYITNAWLEKAPKDNIPKDRLIFQARNVCNAVREHWTIEADNYVRDVSFKEDECKAPKSKTSKVMAILRTIAIDWLKLQKPNNFKELAEFFSDCPKIFEQKLKLSKFIT